MDTQNIGLLQALSAKMSYLTQRQNVIAENIANADTPSYQPHDLKPVDFGAALSAVTGEQSAKLTPVRTNAKHLGSAGSNIYDIHNEVQRKTYEVSPDGNAVVMEEQMVKSSQNSMDYNMITSLYEKNVGLIRTAIDSGH